MTTPKLGRRTTQASYDDARWRHALFVEIRKTGKYKGACTTGDPDAIDKPKGIARASGLVWHGSPCIWAIPLIEQDLAGDFDPERPPRMLIRRRTRIVEIFSSPRSMDVGVYSDRRQTTGATHWGSHRPDDHMKASDSDWRKLEKLAVAAARQAVKELKILSQPPDRDELKEPPDPSEPVEPAAYAAKSVYGGKESAKYLQIEKLALLLTGATGVKLDRRTVDRWSEILRVDRPS